MDLPDRHGMGRKVEAGAGVVDDFLHLRGKLAIRDVILQKHLSGHRPSRRRRLMQSLDDSFSFPLGRSLDFIGHEPAPIW
jgi:hypothetical protein